MANHDDEPTPRRTNCMRLTTPLALRRIINSNYHPFQTIPKSDRWHTREQQHRFTAWQYGAARSTYKVGNMKLNKLFIYLDMQRRDEKRLEKFYAEERLNAALAEHHFEYKHFRNMLDKAHILLDNVVLSQLAIYEPRTFQSLVALAKEMAIKDGRPVIPDDEFKFDVHLDESLFGEPFPRSVQPPKGPVENYKIKPRKLDPSEY
ncbi:ribosomal protein L20 [Ancylostoma ceylanicum]|uniref:Ribosomal protein L20 n=3 Tax=Ancylostoma ceylanicum TaxID=53326 RepID=A0A0D6LF13_9BILA|nr:ribosomal protein L20 [Ancylostoma ceylanicum]EYC06823.1 hypothetical protein Y032_0073g723 [Ancylostoma ceylanicum]